MNVPISIKTSTMSDTSEQEELQRITEEEVVKLHHQTHLRGINLRCLGSYQQQY